MNVFSFFFSTYVYVVCMHVFMCGGKCICVYMHIWKSEIDVRYLSQLLYIGSESPT